MPAQIEDIVWGESRGLASKNGDDGALPRLYAVVTSLAKTASSRGIDDIFKRAEAPVAKDAANTQRYQTMSATVALVDNNNWTGNTLPKRAVLWEITDEGSAREGNPPIPTTASWIAEPGVAHGGDFVAGSSTARRVYRLFESDAAPEGADDLFVSSYTGSNLPGPPSEPVGRLPWVIGILATLVFVAGGLLAIWTGRTLSDAHAALANRSPAQQVEFLAKAAQLCAAEWRGRFGATELRVCDDLLDDEHKARLFGKDDTLPVWSNAAATPIDTAARCRDAPETAGCDLLWRAAVALEQTHGLQSKVFGWVPMLSAYLTGVGKAGAISLLVPFLMLAGGLGTLIVALGLGTRGRVAGVWIDARNRVSLARAQVSLWSCIALGGYACYALVNAGLATADIGSTSSDAPSTFDAFPLIPASIAAALGISFTSPMISKLILDTKTAGVAVADDRPLKDRGAPFLGNATSGLVKRASPALARITDIFMGEENSVSDTVDVSRLQNVVITVTLVLGYAALLISTLRTIAPDDILKAFAMKRALFTSLPDPGVSFASLLLLSHATYLVAKAHDDKPESAE